MIHDAFLTHLQGAGLVAPVKNAFTTEPVENYAEDFPVVMLYPLSDTLGENGYDNLVIQEQIAEVVCLVGCKLTDLKARVLELRQAAIGWTPPAADGQEWDAMEGQGGNLEGLSGEYIWWRETFTVRTQFRQTT
jgi:hypothetical protein